MIVSNTTPFIALCSIDALDLYPRLYGRVHVAEAVVAECAAGGPVSVPSLSGLTWVEIHPAPKIDPQSRLWMLDAGERDTIELALALRSERVVIDERIGRNLAELMGLRVMGTLGVLARARRCGLIESFSSSAERMRAAGIHFHPALIAQIATKLGEAGA